MFSRAKRFTYPQPEETSPYCERHSRHEASFAKTSALKTRRKSSNLIKWRNITMDEAFRQTSGFSNGTKATSSTSIAISTGSGASRGDEGFHSSRTPSPDYQEMEQLVKPLLNREDNRLEDYQPLVGFLADLKMDVVKESATGCRTFIKIESTSEGEEIAPVTTPSLPSAANQEIIHTTSIAKRILDNYNKETHPEDYQRLVNFVAEFKIDVASHLRKCSVPS